MDNIDHQGGDLADIVCGRTASSDVMFTNDSWQFSMDPDATSFPRLSTDNFITGDLLLHELLETSFSSGDFTKPHSGYHDGGVGDEQIVAQNISIDEDMKKPFNIFSRILQRSARTINPLPPMAAAHCAQMSSPRPPAFKRRKGQIKKVICIPAPAAAGSRLSSGVVPSDLWAWRKYGQKPIKGSPYPRGYYRCSSSKGCSARKQVERSRSDPSMLVISYTSEHNHPRPTQRNALAGSTRPQPSKKINQRTIITPSATSLKEEEEPKEIDSTSSSSSSSLLKVKEQVVEEMEKANDRTIDDLFYEPIQSDDFFKGLCELENGLRSKNGMDSFVDMFDWEGSSSGDQLKEGL